MVTNDYQLLRLMLREQRRQLPAAVSAAAAATVTQTVIDQPIFQTATHIAGYLPHDGEIDPTTIFQHAWSLQKHCYLPVLGPNYSMQFAHYTATTPLQRNRFGLLEPDLAYTTTITRQHLDLIVMPLVGFDQAYHRLGMGQGYYDRYLANHRRGTPYLIAIAFACQEVASGLVAESWDIAPDLIITEQGIL